MSNRVERITGMIIGIIIGSSLTFSIMLDSRKSKESKSSIESKPIVNTTKDSTVKDSARIAIFQEVANANNNGWQIHTYGDYNDIKNMYYSRTWPEIMSIPTDKVEYYKKLEYKKAKDYLELNGPIYEKLNK